MFHLRARVYTTWRRALAGTLVLLIVMVAQAPYALAHAELRQASPDVGETVGGEFHQIAMQFIGLDPQQTHQAKLFDPAGNLITESSASEGQRLVIPIDPLTVPGDYLVTYAVHGIDGDFTEESFGFTFDPAADEPSGITIAEIGPEGFDFVLLTLLLIAAGLAAFLVTRVMSALRAHRGAQAVQTPPSD